MDKRSNTMAALATKENLLRLASYCISNTMDKVEVEFELMPCYEESTIAVSDEKLEIVGIRPSLTRDDNLTVSRFYSGDYEDELFYIYNTLREITVITGKTPYLVLPIDIIVTPGVVDDFKEKMLTLNGIYKIKPIYVIENSVLINEDHTVNGGATNSARVLVEALNWVYRLGDQVKVGLNYPSMKKTVDAINIVCQNDTDIVEQVRMFENSYVTRVDSNMLEFDWDVLSGENCLRRIVEC